MFNEYPQELFNTTSAENLLKILFDFIQPKSVLDAGGSNGSWLKAFSMHQIDDLMGADGFYVPHDSLLIPKEKFYEADLSKELILNRQFDPVVSLEVAEHLPEKASDTFVKNLTAHGDTILFLAAIPNQGGPGHLNEQFPSYWQDKFAKYDYNFYDLIRPKIWTDQRIFYWYRQNTFLVANKNSYIAQNYTPSDRLNVVHPELFEREAVRVLNLENGKAGINTGLHVFLRSIYEKLGFN